MVDEWKFFKGGLLIINRELVIGLVKYFNVVVIFFVLKCVEEDKKVVGKYNVRIVEVKKWVVFNELFDWLSFFFRDFVVDVIIGYGVKFGR